MKKILIVTLAIVLGTGLVLGDLSWVYAQEQEEFTLEEITVTALKRVENLQNVPISATAIEGETVLQTGRLTLEQMLRDTAGVEFRGSANETQIYIRGVGSNAGGMGVELNVSISTNGVSATNNQSSRMPSYDVARVEVTRGPDSTLNGRLAAGGTVNIITNEPHHSFETTGSLTSGNYDLFTAQGVINVPVGEKFAIRAAYQSTKRDGFVSYGQGDLDTSSSRYRLMYEPNEKLKVILSGEFGKQQGKGRSASSYTTPIDLTKPFATPRGAYYSPVEAPESRNTSANLYYMDLTYDLAWASLYIQPTYQSNTFRQVAFSRGYTAGSTDDIPDTWSGTFSVGTQEQTTYELRLTSPGEQTIDWLAGFYYLDFTEVTEMAMVMNQATMPAALYPVITDKIERRTTLDTSFYAQGTYNLTDTFSISLGGRYTKDDKSRPGAESGTYWYPLDDGIVNSTLGTRVYFKTSAATVTTKRWDYRLSVQKELSPEQTIYALTSTGFKGGTFNRFPSDPNILAPGYLTLCGPEYLTSYEIGTKNQLLKNTLRINASVFYYNYRDIQLSFSGYPFAASTGVDPDYRSGSIQNGGDAVTYGAELESEWLLTRVDRVGLNISYLNAKFDEMKFKPLKYLEGTKMPQSPSWRFSPSYQHTFDLGVNGVFVFAIDGTYVSDAIYSIPNDGVNTYNKRDSYFKGNANLNYYSQDGRWSLSGFVRNIFDKVTYDAISQPRVYSGYSNVTFVSADPRTFGITLSVNF